MSSKSLNGFVWAVLVVDLVIALLAKQLGGASSLSPQTPLSLGKVQIEMAQWLEAEKT